MKEAYQIWSGENHDELLQDFADEHEVKFNQFCEDEYNKVCDVEETNNSLSWNRSL